MTEEDYRSDEYRALLSGQGSDRSSFSCRRIPIDSYGQDLSHYFSGITLVRKLQETRAFVGFSRVEPNVSASCQETLRQLSTAGLSWAPAIRVFGEGIFFQFDAKRVQEWSERQAVKERASKLTRAYNKAAQRWGRPVIEIRPEYVLIHTLSHLLINRLSYDCGYGSSSIRERIYCDLSSTAEAPHEMLGLLLYTASGDSEGSLGGLVRMGEPGHLEGVVWRALEDAIWCSSDPVCSQSEGQGPDSWRIEMPICSRPLPTSASNRHQSASIASRAGAHGMTEPSRRSRHKSCPPSGPSSDRGTARASSSCIRGQRRRVPHCALGWGLHGLVRLPGERGRLHLPRP